MSDENKTDVAKDQLMKILIDYGVDLPTNVWASEKALQSLLK